MPIQTFLLKLPFSRKAAVRLKMDFMLIVPISRTAGHKEVSDVEEEI